MAIVTALIEGPPSAATENTVRELADALEIDATQGFPGVLQFALPMIGFADGDLDLAARYRDLARCANGTFGRALYDHFIENDFKFPGGIPLVFHDVGHVLAGYSTDPQGEFQQAAFQAGFARRDGFSFLLFGILQFHMGMRITPVAQGSKSLSPPRRPGNLPLQTVAKAS